MIILNFKTPSVRNSIITIASLLLFIASISASGQNAGIPYKDTIGRFQLKKIHTGIKEDIVTGQFVNNIAYVLTKNSHLYKLSSDSIAQQIPIPDSILFQNLVFQSEQEGILVGISKTSSGTENISNDSWWVPIVILLLFGGIGFAIYKGFRKWRSRFFLFIVPLVIVLAISIKLCNSRGQQNEKLQFVNSIHYYFQKPVTNSIGLITSDGCKTWTIFKIPTNFDITGIIALSGKYYLSTFAGRTHMDGDIWRVDPNNKESPVTSFSTKRGLNGITLNPDNKIVAYGTDVVTTFIPETKMVKTKGEIITFDEKLDSLKAMDIHAAMEIKSLDILPGNIIWALMKSGELFKYSVNEWQLKNTNEIANATKIVFVDSLAGFALTKDGKLKCTQNGSRNWADFDIKDNVTITDIKKQAQFIELFGTNGFIGTINE